MYAFVSVVTSTLSTYSHVSKMLCRIIIWKKLLKCVTCLRNLMRIMGCVHHLYWVFVSISSLEGCLMALLLLVSTQQIDMLSITQLHLIHIKSVCSVSSLAWFMSNQETSFVTIGQRVLARPLKYVLSNFFILYKLFT